MIDTTPNKIKKPFTKLIIKNASKLLLDEPTVFDSNILFILSQLSIPKYNTHDIIDNTNTLNNLYSFM